MNIIKKSLSVVLAVLMIMSAFSCLALADLSYAYPTEFNGGFTKTTTAADYFNQVFSKPVYSKAPAKKYAELSAANSTKDLWAYIAVEVYEKNSGVWELSDHYLTPGQDVQFRFYVKGNFSTTTAQLAFLFSKSFFDTPDVDPDPLIGAYNTANTYGAMQNPITDAAINFYNNAGTYKNTTRKTYIPSAVNETVGCLGFMGSTPMSNPKSVAMNSDEPVFVYDSKVKTGLADNTIGYTFFEKSILSARPDCNYFTVMKTANASAEATTTFAESSMALADVDTRDCNQAFIIGTPAAQTYTITYMDGANAITGLTPTSYTAGVGATLPTSVSKTDCKFEGWYDNDGLTGNAVTAIGTEATGNKTFYAKFSALTTTADFKVEHYVMDVTGNYPAAATKTEDKSGTINATITLADYKYKDYEVANGIAYEEGKVGSSVTTSTTIAADGSTVIKLYYARSKYKLTVTAGTGVSAASVKVNGTAFTSGNDVYYDAPITDYSATAKAGYGTPSWSSQPTKMSAKALDLTASATAKTDTAYKVNVYVMDTAGKYGEPIVKDYKGTTDTTATVTDAMITGYCTDAGSSAAFSKDDAKTNDLNGNIDGDGSRVLTVYLKRAQYELKLIAGTGIDSVTGAGTYYFGESVTINAVVNANYNWSKWSDEVTTQERKITISGAETLTANALVKSGVAYTVEHYVMDVKGEYPATANLTESDGSGTAGATLTFTDLKKGSYEVADGIAYKEGTVGGQKVTSTTIAADGSTVIKLYYERAQYVLTVVADTGVATASVKVNGAAFTSGNKVYYGAAITDYTATAEAGYGEPEWDSTPETMPANALTLTASVSASGYKAYFKPDGGKWATGGQTSQLTKNYTVEDILTAPDNISKVGHTFKGWKITTAAGDWVLDTVYNDAITQTKLAGVAGKTGNVTFTAQWEAIKYKVTFADYEGNEIYTADVPYGETPVYDEATYGVPAKPADADNTYTFTGWKNGNNGLMPVTGEITYVAQFSAVGQTYKVTFNVPGQTPSVFEKKANKAVITIADPTYEKGYVFLGWFDGEGTEAKLVSESFATTGYTVNGADAEFFAHFEKGKFTAKFVWGDGEKDFFTTDEVLFGESYEFKSEPEAEANPGFIFKGWALKDGAKETDKVTSFTMGDGKDVYYAIWVRDLTNCGIKSVVSSTNGDYFNIGIANYTVTFNANQNPTAIKVVDSDNNAQIFTKASFEEFTTASGIASINTAPEGDSWVLEMVLPAGKYLVIMGYDNDGETVFDDANPFEYERTYDEITKQTDLANEKIKVTDALVPVVDDTTSDSAKAEVAVLNGNRLKYVIEADTSIYYIKAVTTYVNGEGAEVSYTNLYKQTTNLGDENIFKYADGVWTIAPLYSAAVDGQVQTTKFYYRYNYSDVWMTLKVDNDGKVEDYANTVEVKNQLNVTEIDEEAKTVKIGSSDELENITAGKQTLTITTGEDVQRIRLVWNGTKNATFTRESGNCEISINKGVVTWTITDFNFKAGVTYELQTRTDKWNSTWKTITVSAE